MGLSQNEEDAVRFVEKDITQQRKSTILPHRTKLTSFLTKSTGGNRYKNHQEKERHHLKTNVKSVLFSVCAAKKKNRKQKQTTIPVMQGEEHE